MSLVVTVYYFAYYYNLYLSVFLFYPVDKNAEKNELSDCRALRVKPISYSLVGSKNLAVVCRSCWMPGANEVLGCPQNFQTTFLVFFIASVVTFTKKSLLGCPPCLSSYTGNQPTSFSSFTFVSIDFLLKSGPLHAPRVDARRCPTVRTLPPLHAIGNWW